IQRQIMKSNFYQKLFGGVLLFLLCATVEIHAQGRFGGGGGGFGGGGFGGFGGFGGGGGGNFNRGGGNTSGSGQYNNNGTVGNAVISVDPATHNLIVIADKQTSEQIRRVIRSEAGATLPAAANTIITARWATRSSPWTRQRTTSSSSPTSRRASRSGV